MGRPTGGRTQGSCLMTAKIKSSGEKGGRETKNKEITSRPDGIYGRQTTVTPFGVRGVCQLIMVYGTNLAVWKYELNGIMGVKALGPNSIGNLGGEKKWRERQQEKAFWNLRNSMTHWEFFQDTKPQTRVIHKKTASRVRAKPEIRSWGLKYTLRSIWGKAIAYNTKRKS